MVAKVGVKSKNGRSMGLIVGDTGSQPSDNLKLVSDFFIALSNDTQNLITNLKLQKLVYYVQAWHLAVFNDQAFPEDFEAWVHGPVVPSLYRKYKELSYHPITEEKPDSEQLFQNFNENLQSIVNDVVEGYFGRTAYELEQLTHTEAPWIIARNDVPAGESSSTVIPKDSMREYYRQLVIS